MPIVYFGVRESLQGVSIGAWPLVLSIWACKIFLISKLSYLLFCNPTHQTEAGTVQIGGKLLIANHLDQSLWLANQKQEAAVISHLSHSSLASDQLCCAFYQRPTNWAKYVGEKPISWAKPAYVDFVSLDFNLQGNILRTDGHVLRCSSGLQMWPSPCQNALWRRDVIRDTKSPWKAHQIYLTSWSTNGTPWRQKSPLGNMSEGAHL
jgi:hypothetical protein